MTRVLGVDGGIRGGLAIVEVGDDAMPFVVDAIDIPTIGTGAKERVDVLAIFDWIVANKPQQAFIERAQAMPKQGSSSGFKYGRAVGALEGIVAACRLPLTIAEPTAWKKFHGLRGRDKELSRAKAIQLFPNSHALFARKRDHGRAEAALIALAGVSHAG